VWVILRRFIPNALELAAANAHDGVVPDGFASSSILERLRAR
jgi:hypothetical protein